MFFQRKTAQIEPDKYNKLSVAVSLVSISKADRMKIKNATYVKSCLKLSDCPSPDRMEVAFIGRSNVGKSSLINMLTNRKKLAKTSSTPGKTQTINHFNMDDQWYLVDLPGYGWSKVSKTQKAEWERYINAYLLERETLVCLFILIDIRHTPQKIDLEMMEWCAMNQVPFVMVFTKADKLSKTKVEGQVQKYLKQLKMNWETLPLHFVTSSETRFGSDEVLEYIDSLNSTYAG